MPVQPASEGGKPGYRWGETGKVYTYTRGNEVSRRRAKMLASRQGRAIEARRHRDDALERKPPRRPSSRPLEALYVKLAREWSRKMRRLLLEAFRAWETQRRPGLRRLDADADDDDELTDLDAADLVYWLRRSMSDVPIILPAIGASAAAIAAKAQQVERLSTQAARRTMIRAGASPAKLTQRGIVASTLQSQIGIETEPIRLINIAPTAAHAEALEGFVRLNLDLISRIPQDWLVGTESWMSKSIIEGSRYTGIQRELMQRLGIAPRHAKLIARDQVGKLNGQITQVNQGLAGVEKYMWMTVDDERVRGRPGGRFARSRPSHWALDGKTFSWSDPPVAGPGTQPGHPGDAIQCRCYADPILPDDIMED
jgi:SPP1 gp7 family putative phage head morphogenesis protein